VSALPAAAEAVAAFLAHDVEAGSRPSTLGRRLAAIRYAHKLAGHPAPTDDERVKATMRGIRRSVGTAPRKKTPATAERIVAMALAAGDDIKGQRDRALLLIGFAGAFRRSELIALDVEDLEESELGFRVTIRHSKTDQEGAGQTIAVVRGSVACPITALKGWLAAAGITSGPIFRSVKRGGRGGRALACAIGRRHREVLCRAGGARSRAVCRTLNAVRLPDERRQARCVHI
jgi:integrase